MKKTFFTLCLCAGVIAGAAELKWGGGAPWKKEENGEFTINYQNKGYPNLSSKQKVKSGNFYKITFECKRDGESVPALHLYAQDGKHPPKLRDILQHIQYMDYAMCLFLSRRGWNFDRKLGLQSAQRDKTDCPERKI